MKLVEGEIYSFEVLKRTTIPEEGEFFLLRHQSGRRLLLPEQYYSNYNILPGSTIECKVDKVSCTGKVYLEPLHPLYREGNEYLFDCVGAQNTEDNPLGRVLLVKDVFSNTIRVLCACTNKLENSKIPLTVERVKKGLPELFCKGDREPDALKGMIGTPIVFNINGVERSTESEEVYILQSKSGHKASLKIKHFKNYGFNVGDDIMCEVYGYTGLGELRVEPENPFYKVGEVYEFELAAHKGLLNSKDIDSEILTLIDVSGNLCGIEVSSQLKSTLKSKTQLKCRVVGFRKGRPKLEFIDQSSSE